MMQDGKNFEVPRHERIVQQTNTPAARWAGYIVIGSILVLVLASGGFRGYVKG